MVCFFATSALQRIGFALRALRRRQRWNQLKLIKRSANSAGRKYDLERAIVINYIFQLLIYQCYQSRVNILTFSLQHKKKNWPAEGMGVTRNLSREGHNFQLKTSFVFVFFCTKRENGNFCIYFALKTNLGVFNKSPDNKSSIFRSPTVKKWKILAIFRGFRAMFNLWTWQSAHWRHRFLKHPVSAERYYHPTAYYKWLKFDDVIAKIDTCGDVQEMIWQYTSPVTVIYI